MRQVASGTLSSCRRQLKVMKADILVCCCTIIRKHSRELMKELEDG